MEQERKMNCGILDASCRLYSSFTSTLSCNILFVRQMVLLKATAQALLQYAGISSVLLHITSVGCCACTDLWLLQHNSGSNILLQLTGAHCCAKS
jgi:hypothetical protein